jgi:hypothetical protein
METDTDNKCEILTGIPKPKRGITCAGDEKIMAIGTKMQEMCEAFLKNMQMISNGTKKGK